MKLFPTNLEGCVVVEPRVFNDDRGYFYESYNADKFVVKGLTFDVQQSNVSVSSRGTLRGLHYQWPRPQGKLVSVLDGEVWDVAVDIRRDSPQFGRWTAVVLSSDNHRQLWIPEGFAHGFVVLSERAVFSYLCTDTYQPEFEASIAWDDPDLEIDWPIRDVLLSPKDAKAPRLKTIADSKLPSISGIV